MSKESCTPRMLPYTGKDHPWANWVIFYPTPLSEQRKRKFFANRGEAEEFKKILGISYSHYVSTGEQPLTIAERSELTSANLILQPYGISLVELSVKMSDWITELQNEFEESMDDAISNIIKSGFHSPAVVPLHETIDSYLCGIKERRSAAYFLSVKTHLNSFKMFMGLIDPNMDIKNVTKQNVLAWFDHHCSIAPRTGLKREKNTFVRIECCSISNRLLWEHTRHYKIIEHGRNCKAYIPQVPLWGVVCYPTLLQPLPR